MAAPSAALVPAARPPGIRTKRFAPDQLYRLYRRCFAFTPRLQFEVVGPRGKWPSPVRERTPHDAVLHLEDLLNSEYINEPNGLYKLFLDGEVVAALDYMRL